MFYIVISIEEIPDGATIGTPRRIAANEDRGNSEDMTYGHSGDGTGIYKFIKDKTDNNLFLLMDDLLATFTVPTLVCSQLPSYL